LYLFGFISSEEIAELPDDADAAFVKFVEISYNSLRVMLSGLDGRDSWEEAQDIRHKYMNIIVAAAKQYEIESIKDTTIPPAEGFSFADFRDFSSTVDHFVTQIAISNSKKRRAESVGISDSVREDIRTYIYHLRDLIERSEIAEPKKSVLMERLAAFESELTKKRLSLASVAVLAIYIASIPGSMAGTADAATKIVNKIISVVSVAHEVEVDQRQLPPVTQPIPISSPKKPAGARSSFADLDDDIPF